MVQPSGLGKGEFVGYDGYKHIEGTKIHALILREALPLNIQVGPAMSMIQTASFLS
ncbi:MAG: hypothetical protein QW803_13285 [Candidatus Methanomethylicia archaeon]